MDATPANALPKEFLERLSAIVPDDRLHRVLAAFNNDRKTTFRVNTLKIKTVDALRTIGKLGFMISIIDWQENAFVLENKTLRELTDTGLYKEGCIYVQSLSSMLPPLILDPKPGERVLDITAAPGSKTTQMATLMENKGEILANDASRVRIFRLKANITLQGATIARVTNDDARAIWQKYPEYFDKTLVDVPCSMEGRFQANDPKSFADWSVKKVRELSRMQKWILRSAVSATKPGGTIVYSTCTLSPEENESVIDWIIKKEKGTVVVAPVSLPHFSFDPALPAWEGALYDPTISGTGRVFPSSLMEGFFIAKLIKVSSTLPTAMRRENTL